MGQNTEMSDQENHATGSRHQNEHEANSNSQQTCSSGTLQLEEEPASVAIGGTLSGSVKTAIARWCTVNENGEFEINTERIKTLSALNSSDDFDDILRGNSITGRVWPLIFDDTPEIIAPVARFRTLGFYRQLLEETDNSITLYHSLDASEKRTVCVGVRDLYLAAWRGLLDESESTLLTRICQVISNPIDLTHVQGMDISFYPSTTFSVLKFIENLDGLVDEELIPCFAQIMDQPKLFAAFVNHVELSFHNFENIVPLDLWMETRLVSKAGQDSELSSSFSNPQQIAGNYDIWTCKLDDSSSKLLLELSLLDLYVSPLNKASRGGDRFIFQSTILSKSLTRAVQQSGVLTLIEKGALSDSFQFVNYVFRCNRFKPGSGKFSSHRDTPYYDAERRHVSKYTLLIYLTGGTGKPALRLGDVELESLEGMTCVIFNQFLEHEGLPFEDTEKVFLRTELVFEDRKLHHDNAIAALFSEACYMTGHAVFDNEISKYAHDCYERANSLHWAIEKTLSTRIYFQKSYRGVNFITNGFDYWFLKKGEVKLRDCGVLAILDYFNCKINGKPFRSLCKSDTIRGSFIGLEDVWNKLLNTHVDENPGLRMLMSHDVDALFKPKSSTPFSKRSAPWSDDEDDDGDDDEGPGCCPFHCWKTFDAWEDDDVHNAYNVCWSYTKRKIYEAPVTIFGHDIMLNASKVMIKDDKLYILRDLQDKALPPINFAACWNGIEPPAFIGIDKELDALNLLLPPIQFHESDQGYHLKLDFFRNDWVLRVDDEYKIPVPVISNDIDYDGEGGAGFLLRVGDYNFDFQDGLEICAQDLEKTTGTTNRRNIDDSELVSLGSDYVEDNYSTDSEDEWTKGRRSSAKKFLDIDSEVDLDSEDEDGNVGEVAESNMVNKDGGNGEDGEDGAGSETFSGDGNDRHIYKRRKL
jgi:hypothetical protein